MEFFRDASQVGIYRVDRNTKLVGDFLGKSPPRQPQRESPSPACWTGHRRPLSCDRVCRLYRTNKKAGRECALPQMITDEGTSATKNITKI